MIWYRQEGNNGDGGQREFRIIKTKRVHTIDAKCRHSPKQSLTKCSGLAQASIILYAILLANNNEMGNASLYDLYHF